MTDTPSDPEDPGCALRPRPRSHARRPRCPGARRASATSAGDRRGALPEPDDRQVFSYATDLLPTVSVDVAGRRLRTHLDTGYGGGLMLPAALKDSLPLLGPPVDDPSARTVARVVQQQQARLAGAVVLGGREIREPEIALNPVATTGNVGSQLLQDYEVTLDPPNRRIRLRPGHGAGDADD